MEKLGKIFGRIIIPLATPFTNDKEQDLNFDAAAALADYVITNDYCDSLLIAGTSGEFNTLTIEERFELFRVVKEAVANRVPLMAGACSGSTREAVYLAQKAEQLRFNAVMVVSPYYCRPTQEGAYQHFAAVAQAIKLPVMLYNIPIFTGFNLETTTLARLTKEYNNIVGIKDEAGINPTQMTQYEQVTPEKFTIYNGDDTMALCGMVQGATGVISGGSHMIGGYMRKMINRILNGDLKSALGMHRTLHPFFKAFGSNGRINPIPIWKAALNLCGHQVGPPRLPLDPATPDEIEIIRKHLRRLGLVD